MKYHYKLYKWLGAVFLILILILTLSTVFLYKMNIDKMQEQLTEYNEAIVNNYTSSFTESINEIYKTFELIESNNNELIDKKTGKIDYYSAMGFIEKLFSIKEYSKIINEIIIFPNSINAITTKGSYSFLDIFGDIYSNSKYPPYFWRNYKSNDNHIKILPSSIYLNKTISDNGAGSNLIGAISNKSEFQKGYKIVVFIDAEKIFRIPEQKSYMENSGFCIFDKDKNIFLQKNLENTEIESLKQSINFNSAKTFLNINGSDYYLVKTEVHEYIVVNKILDGSILSGTKMVNILIIVLSALTCFIISILFTLFFYKSVKKILMLIGQKNISNDNEFKIIDKEIKNLMNQNVNLLQTVETLNDINIRNIFQKVINGIYITEDDLAKMCSSVAENDSNNNYFVIIVVDIKTRNTKEKSSNTTYLSNQMPKAFEMLWKEKLPYSNIYEFQTCRFTSLVLLEKNITKKMLETTLNNLVREFELKFNTITLCLSVSDIHKDVMDIKKAYDESLKCILIKPITSQNAVIYYNKVFELQNYFFPFDLVEKLKSQLQIGNTQECLDIIDNIITKNVILNLDLFTFKNLCYQLMRILYQAAPREILEAINQTHNFVDLSTELNSLNDIGDFSSFFKNLIMTLTKLIRQDLDNDSLTSQEKISFVKEYIRLHYNEDIYLENLSAMVDLSPKYLSRHFKKVTGINCIEYINKFRVLRAKELLRNQKLTLNEIATMVGYKSNSALTINFDKYMGMPPAKYRIMILQ